MVTTQRLSIRLNFIAIALVFLGMAAAASASAAIGARSGSRLQARGIQSQAVCLDQFSWMENSGKQTPCLAAAWLAGSCQGGNWFLPALPNAQSHYTPPDNTTKSKCYCSWAVYNLLQGCAFCQGESFDTAIFNWDPWRQNCTSDLLTDGPFPNDIVIPEETSIPYWATTDPNAWTNHRFDPSRAQNLASENKPDIIQENQTNSRSKKAPIGAIAGGAVGGVVLLLAIAAFALRRHKALQRKRRADAAGDPVYGSQAPLSPPLTYAASPGPSMMTSEFGGRVPMAVTSYTSYVPPTSPISSNSPYSPTRTVSPHGPSYQVISSNRPTHGHSYSNNSVTSFPHSQLSPLTDFGAIEPFFLPPLDTHTDSRSDTASPAPRTDAGSSVRERLNPPAYFAGATPNNTPEKVPYQPPIARTSIDAQPGNNGLSGPTLRETRSGTLFNDTHSSLSVNASVPNPARLRLVGQVPDDHSNDVATEGSTLGGEGYPVDRKM